MYSCSIPQHDIGNDSSLSIRLPESQPRLQTPSAVTAAHMAVSVNWGSFLCPCNKSPTVWVSY